MVEDHYKSEFQRAWERYYKTFGEEYPYVYMNLTLEQAVVDMGRRVRSGIPVPESEYEHMLKNPTPSVDERREELRKARADSKGNP